MAGWPGTGKDAVGLRLPYVGQDEGRMLSARPMSPTGRTGCCIPSRVGGEETKATVPDGPPGRARAAVLTTPAPAGRA